MIDTIKIGNSEYKIGGEKKPLRIYFITQYYVIYFKYIEDKKAPQILLCGA